jgi:transcriptional regulator with XRE-family HTH domain
MSDFGELLREYRSARGLGQRALARASEINPAIINRFESGERLPSGPEQVNAIARALALDSLQTDRLLSSAGFWPAVYLAVGPQDQTLLKVARLLASPGVSQTEKARFRQVVDLLEEQWTGATQR